MAAAVLAAAGLSGLPATSAAQYTAPAAAPSAAPARNAARELAATCAHCHGTDGRAVAGEAMTPLAGLPKDFILTQLMAFRSGARPATVMHQLARGYTPQQLEQIAAHFAAQK